MRYADGRGRPQRLTATQAVYLGAAVLQGRLVCGWGGLSSTLTVRLMEERGLVTVRYDRRDTSRRWEITSITPLGQNLAERWRARNSNPMELTT